jgi:hypothetical protein
MSELPESVAPTPAQVEAHAARLKKFKREQLIVDYLNRGVSIVEIAARIGVGEKRMRAIVRAIIARRQPHPPEEFVVIQISRLNEAMLNAFSAMSPKNLKAVAQVVRIVGDLDRYHGFDAADWRRRLEKARLNKPDEETAAYGGALFCSAELALQDAEIERLDCLLAGGLGVLPGSGVLPEIPLQGFEKIDSAPERVEARPSPRFSGERVGVRGSASRLTLAPPLIRRAPPATFSPGTGRRDAAAASARKICCKTLKTLIPCPRIWRPSWRCCAAPSRGARWGTRRSRRTSSAHRPLDRRAPAGVATTARRASRMPRRATRARKFRCNPLKTLTLRPRLQRGLYSAQPIPPTSPSARRRTTRFETQRFASLLSIWVKEVRLTARGAPIARKIPRKPLKTWNPGPGWRRRSADRAKSRPDRLS